MTMALPVWSRWSQHLRAWGTAFDHALVRWLQPGPGWPHNPADRYTEQRDRAWRTLYHLGINQP